MALKSKDYNKSFKQLLSTFDLTKRTAQEAIPNRTTLADYIESIINDELKNAAVLTPDVQREISQAVRGQQAARGNLYGAGPAAQETMALTRASESQRAQRMSNAAKFLTMGTSPWIPSQIRTGAQTVYGLDFQNKLAQPNPWVMGLQGANTVMGGVANSGWSPFQAKQQTPTFAFQNPNSWGEFWMRNTVQDANWNAASSYYEYPELYRY